MKKRWRLVASLLLVMALLVGGCASKAIKPLTDDEKNTMIEIALDDPEVLKWLGGESKYKTEVGWIAIGWEDSDAVGWARLDYEEIADGNLPSGKTFPSQTATIHPRVLIRVGEPERKHIVVAFNRETKEIIYVEPLPVLRR